MIIHSNQIQEFQGDAVRGGKGPAFSKLLAGRSNSSQLRAIAVNRLPPGSSMGPKENRKREEIFYFISGTGVVREGKAALQAVGPGSCYLTGPKEISEVMNNGTEDLVFFSVLLEWRSFFSGI